MSARTIIPFPTALAAEKPAQKVRAAVLALYTPREWLRSLARLGVPRSVALARRGECRRCAGVHPARLQRIATEEYGRMQRQAQEAAQ